MHKGTFAEYLLVANLLNHGRPNVSVWKAMACKKWLAQNIPVFVSIGRPMGWSDKTDSVGEQIKTLQSMGKQWVGISAIAVFIVPGLLLLYVALSKREYGLIPFVFAFCFFALIVTKGLPHIRRAIQGIDSNDRCDGVAIVSIEESSETTYYKADLTVPGRGRWIFQFRPQGWTPVEAQLQVECRFIRGFDWPVLVVAESGLIHPSEKPKTMRWNI